MQHTQTMIPFLHELADAAEAHILPHFRADNPISNKAGDGSFDPVTEADRGAEASMRALIEERFPSHGIIGEEFDSVRMDSDSIWILDPIDGTRAFICGLPLWGVLIGLRNNGYPEFGMICQPFLRERFWGDGHSAFYARNKTKKSISTRPCRSIADAVLSTTSPELFEPEFAPKFQHLKASVKLCRYGYDCYAYAMVAMGQIDCVIESGLKPFDIEPIVPIIEGAGGVVTDYQGRPVVGGGDVLACGDRALHDQILQLLAS